MTVEENTMPSEKTPRITLMRIASAFFCIGLASFSLAAIGEAKIWMTKKKKWFTDDEYMQGLGLAQLMPGAPTVNLSSYLGYCLNGLPGAAISTLSFLTPCFLLMLLLSHLYLTYGDMPVVVGLFRGLGALVVGLVLNTIINLLKSGVKSLFNALMSLTGFVMVFCFKMGIVEILLITGGASLIVVYLAHRFPVLSRLTGDSSGVLQKGVSNRNAEVFPEHRQTRHALRWRNAAKLVFWLLLILLVDLFLIHLRPELIKMCGSFLQIGAVVFGSGYAMLPFIQDVVINRFGWLTTQEFAVALALSLITPGPVTIIAVFIGYKVAGPIGAFAAMVNMYYPAWAMTALVAAPFARAGRIVFVKLVVGGIVAAFVGTLFVVLIKLCTSMLVDIPTILLAAGAFFVQRFVKVDTVWIVLGGAAISLALFH